MKVEKYCWSCGKTSVFYKNESTGKTYRCCDKCSADYTAEVRNIKIKKNIENILKNTKELYE